MRGAVIGNQESGDGKGKTQINIIIPRNGGGFLFEGRKSNLVFAIFRLFLRSPKREGEVPEWPKGTVC